MSFSLLFWILMLLWLVFGLWSWPRTGHPASVWTWLPDRALLFVLLLLLGWHVFGQPLHP